MSAPLRRTDWLSPQTLLAILGMLGMAYTSYTAFQVGTADKIADLRTEVAVLKQRVAALEHRP